jgi:hypothetical protein
MGEHKPWSVASGRAEGLSEQRYEIKPGNEVCESKIKAYLVLIPSKRHLYTRKTQAPQQTKNL